MSYADIPADTDAQRILAALDELNGRVDALVAGYNATGANVQWMVDNLQGIFAMLANPAFMSQMMGQLTTGALNGGQPEPSPAA